MKPVLGASIPLGGKSKALTWLLAGAAILTAAGRAPAQDPPKGTDAEWKSLFNGKDLKNWETYLGPEGTVGQVRGKPIGANQDPKGVFGVAEEDGAPAIRISGEIWGGLYTLEEFENYHVRVEFKWGKRVYSIRDSGFFYHAVGPHGVVAGGGGRLATPDTGFFMECMELQIVPGVIGDFASLGRPRANLEGKGRVSSGTGQYTKGGKVLEGVYYAGRSPAEERPEGQWNVLEVLCVGATCIHVINGKVCMVLTEARRKVDDKVIPLTRGRIGLQSEGCEVFWRKVEIKPVREIPKEYLQ